MRDEPCVADGRHEREIPPGVVCNRRQSRCQLLADVPSQFFNSPVHVTSQLPRSVFNCAPGCAKMSVSWSPRKALPATISTSLVHQLESKSILPIVLLCTQRRIRSGFFVSGRQRFRSTLFHSPRFSIPPDS